MPKRKRGAGLSKISKDAKRMRLLRQDEVARARNVEYSRLYQQKKREDESFREEMRIRQAERRKVKGRREQERKRNAMAMRRRRHQFNLQKHIVKVCRNLSNIPELFINLK